MSSLRQVKKGVSEADVEAPADDKGKNSSEPPKAAFTTFSASSRGSSHNPVLVAKAIIRKVCDLLVSSDEEDLSSAGGIVALLKDIIVGFIIGVFFTVPTISILLFLDHRNIVHSQGAHNFRNRNAVNDPETIATLEESSDLKFMTFSEYEAQKEALDAINAKLVSNTDLFEKRTQELDTAQKEIDAIKSEYDTLYHNPILKLDKYCGGCTWGNKFTCDARVAYLEHMYGSSPLMAKIATVEVPSCVEG